LYCFFFLYVAGHGSGRFSVDSLLSHRRATFGSGTADRDARVGSVLQQSQP
jgi:hypothetical protein